MKVKFLKDSLYALDKVNSVSAKKGDIIDMPTILAETYIAKDLVSELSEPKKFVSPKPKNTKKTKSEES